MMKRDHDDERDASHERWLVSYADFITLMFAFFAVLYATSEKDLEKSKEFQDSIKKFLVKAGAFGESGGQVQQGEKNNELIEPPIQTFRPNKAEKAETLDKTETFIEGKFSEAERKKYIGDIVQDEMGVRITLLAGAVYAPGSSKFTPEAMAFVTKLSELLPLSKRKFMIEGHTMPGETGGMPSTWDFASARAVNMLRYLQKSQSLKPNTLVAASFGDSRQIYTGANAAKNSRIEIVLLNQDIEL
jgi:chemotaxis protein MotB